MRATRVFICSLCLFIFLDVLRLLLTLFLSLAQPFTYLIAVGDQVREVTALSCWSSV